MDSLSLRARLNELLEREGLTHADVWRGIDMTESGYYRMLKNGSMDVLTLVAIAGVLRVDPGQLVSDRVKPADAMASEPPVEYGTKRYLEQRVEWLEAEMRKLKEQFRPR